MLLGKSQGGHHHHLRSRAKIGEKVNVFCRIWENGWQRSGTSPVNNSHYFYSTWCMVSFTSRYGGYHHEQIKVTYRFNYMYYHKQRVFFKIFLTKSMEPSWGCIVYHQKEGYYKSHKSRFALHTKRCETSSIQPQVSTGTTINQLIWRSVNHDLHSCIADGAIELPQHLFTYNIFSTFVARLEDDLACRQGGECTSWRLTAYLNLAPSSLALKMGRWGALQFGRMIPGACHCRK